MTTQLTQLRYQTELEFAAILGMPFMGTGNDPTSANNRNIEPWTIAGEKWEALNILSLVSGASTSIRTTTHRRTTSSRTGRWSRSPRIG